MMQSNQFSQVNRGPRNLGGQVRQQHNGQYVGPNAGGRQQNRIPSAMNQGKPGMQQQQGIYYPNFQQQNRQIMQQQQQQSTGGGIVVQNQEPLTTSMLAAAPPQVNFIFNTFYLKKILGAKANVG